MRFMFAIAGGLGKRLLWMVPRVGLSGALVWAILWGATSLWQLGGAIQAAEGPASPGPVIDARQVNPSGAATVMISPGASTVALGLTTTVSVVITNAQNMYGAQVVLGFDKVRLQAQDSDAGSAGTQITPGSCFPTSLPSGFVQDNTADNTTGIISYTHLNFGSTPAVTGTCTLASIIFQGAAQGTGAVSFTTIKLSDPDGNPLAAAGQDGSISIQTAGALAGKVLLQGQPSTGSTDLSGIRVCVGNVSVNNTVGVCSGGTRILTDDGGNFALTGLTQGTYTVTASMPGFLSARKANVAITVGLTTTLTTVTLPTGDLKRDSGNILDVFDLILLGGNWGKTSPQTWP